MDTDFWIDGVTASIIVVFGILSGIFFAKEYKKNRAGLLKDLRWITPLAGLLYLGVFLDFIFVLSMETNFPNSNGEVPIISYIWFPPLMYFVVNFNLKILNVQGKKKILIPLTFVSIVYYIFITINPESSFYWKSPE